MVRIAIVEDEEASVRQLREYLTIYQRESGNELRVSVFADGEEIVRHYQPNYDIILMDVQMRSMDGMTAAEVIRRQDPEVVILFITNMAQYAIRGYAVDALDYLLKPVSYFAFSQRLDRAIERMRKRTARYITLAVRGGSRKLDVFDIRYIESQGHNLTVHLREESLSVSGTMRELEDALVPHGFFRCNKGYLINLAHVDAVREGSAIVDGEPLLISRGRKNAFLEAMAGYMGGRTK